MICCYRTPDTEKDWSDKFNIFLAQCSSCYDNMLICRDFNFPKIHWDSPKKTKGINEVMFMEQLGNYFLMQLHTIPTRGNSILDLVITSVASQVDNMSVLSPLQSGLFTDHGTIIFNLKISKKAVHSFVRTVYDYRRGDFDGLRSALEAIDWLSTIHGDDVNISWLEWKDIFLTALQALYPC